MNGNVSYEKAQRFFIKLAFLFRQVHLECKVPVKSKESIKLCAPDELFGQSDQIGTLQYGGVKYPHHESKPLQLKYVELRLEGQFLKSIHVYEEMKKYMENEDANGWLKQKLSFNNDELKRARKITRLIARGMERKFGLDYLSIGMEPSVLELPRIK